MLVSQAGCLQCRKLQIPTGGRFQRRVHTVPLPENGRLPLRVFLPVSFHFGVKPLSPADSAQISADHSQSFTRPLLSVCQSLLGVPAGALRWLRNVRSAFAMKLVRGGTALTQQIPSLQSHFTLFSLLLFPSLNTQPGYAPFAHMSLTPWEKCRIQVGSRGPYVAVHMCVAMSSASARCIRAA